MASGKADEYDHSDARVIYTVGNIPGKGADIEAFESEFSQGCQCEFKCGPECPCVRAHVNYIDGRLNEGKSGLIFECNPSCVCSDECGNRLVQCGPLDCLSVCEAAEKGLGLVTTRPIARNQFICEYAGEVVGVDEARHRVEENRRNGQMNYTLVVSEFVGEKKIITCIDPKCFGNIGRYCNHSCDPSAKLVPVRVEGLVPRLCLFARRDIHIDEEITFDYAGEVDRSNENRSETPCLCSSSNCSGFLPHDPI